MSGILNPVAARADLTAELNAPLSGACNVTFLGACDQPIESVIIATNAPGFCPVCRFHREKWEINQPDATVRIVSVAAFEAERRRGLYAPESSEATA